MTSHTSHSHFLRSSRVAFIAIPLALVVASLPGCMSFESLEQRQVRHDRARMRRGEPLKHHKDSFELTEHEMTMRLGKFGARDVGASPPQGGAEYEYRPNANARAQYEFRPNPALQAARAAEYDPSRGATSGQVVPAGGATSTGPAPKGGARYAIPGFDDAPDTGRGYVTPAAGTGSGRASLDDTD